MPAVKTRFVVLAPLQVVMDCCHIAMVRISDLACRRPGEIQLIPLGMPGNVSANHGFRLQHRSNQEILEQEPRTLNYSMIMSV